MARSEDPVDAKAKEAIAALEQAWAYYTPEPKLASVELVLLSEIYYE